MHCPSPVLFPSMVTKPEKTGRKKSWFGRASDSILPRLFTHMADRFYRAWTGLSVRFPCFSPVRLSAFFRSRRFARSLCAPFHTGVPAGQFRHVQRQKEENSRPSGRKRVSFTPKAAGKYGTHQPGGFGDASRAKIVSFMPRPVHSQYTPASPPWTERAIFVIRLILGHVEQLAAFRLVKLGIFLLQHRQQGCHHEPSPSFGSAGKPRQISPPKVGCCSFPPKSVE